MSIASEIERLRTAKQSIKSSIVKRGVSVSDTITLDEYGGLLDTIPCTFRGTITPEEDTDTLEISTLEYTPIALSLACKSLEDGTVPSSVIYTYAMKNFPSSACFISPAMERKFVYVKHNSTVVTWNDNSVVIKLPDADKNGYFKKGYTYEYVVTGGVNQ